MTRKNIKLYIWISSLFFVFVLLFLFSIDAQASNLTNLSDKVSRHAPLIGANHEIKFTTPSGIGEVNDYIRIGFDGGFDLSTILFSDVTLTHGPTTGLETSEIVSAVANSTDWGIAVSGNHIDLIHPTDAANGDMAPNDIIKITIGAAHKILNPMALGSKVISLALYDSANNLIDRGSLAVPIFQDQVGVNGAPLGTLPTPVILNFPYHVTTNSLDLDWSQNMDFNFKRYELYMGTSAGVTNLTGTFLPLPGQSNPPAPTDPVDPTQTIVNIAGLAPGRTYYFMVYVFNDQGNSAPSNEVYATTQSGGGTAWPNPPEQPTINPRVCPIFLSNTTIDGTKPAGTTIFINGSSDNVNYPGDLLWNKLVNLGMGSNLFFIYAQDTYGQDSTILTATVNRCRIGDTNCNGVVDDFDLAGLASHWETNWCFADFNEDGIVDDFDLSGLAAHWDSVY